MSPHEIALGDESHGEELRGWPLKVSRSLHARDAVRRLMHAAAGRKSAGA